MGYLDPQKSLVAWVILLGAIAVLCLLLWLLNRGLRRLGIREHHVDRLGTSLLEVERLVRPSIEHVLTSRRERKAEQENGRGDPPLGSNRSGEKS